MVPFYAFKSSQNAKEYALDNELLPHWSSYYKTEDFNLAGSSWGPNAKKLIREVCEEMQIDHELSVNLIMSLVMAFTGKSKVGFAPFHITKLPNN